MEDGGTTPPHPPRRVAPRVGVVVIVGALIAGALAVAHVGPFQKSRHLTPTPTTDIRGTWAALGAFSEEVYVETLHITNERLSTGAFSGTVTSPVGVETITGTVQGMTVSFVITLGTGTDHGSAVLSTSAGKLRMQGTFSNTAGAGGTIVATRASS